MLMSRLISFRPGAFRLTVAIMLAAFEGRAASAVTGAVLDGSMAGVPRAKVTLTLQTGKRDSQTAVTNKSGLFSFGSVPPGEYRVTVEAVGFRPWTVSARQIDDGAVSLPPLILDYGGGCGGRRASWIERRFSQIKGIFSKVDYSKITICQ